MSCPATVCGNEGFKTKAQDNHGLKLPPLCSDLHTSKPDTKAPNPSHELRTESVNWLHGHLALYGRVSEGF